MRKLAGFISAAGMIFAVACGQTDAGITTAVKSKLAADDTVKAYQVDVDTRNHVVTLKGDVNTSIAKERAVQIAKNTDGVRDVIDQLRVMDTAATSGRLTDDNAVVGVDDHVTTAPHRAAAKSRATVRHSATATRHTSENIADKTVNTTKKIGSKTAEETKKVGHKIKGVFTDDNKDSDHDGH